MVQSTATRRAEWMPKMAQALAWTSSEIPAAIFDEYVARLTTALGEAVWVVNCETPELGARLTARLDSTSDQALLRVLVAPETSKRLLWRKFFRIEEVGEFLDRSLRAEAARHGGQPVGEPITTALGDATVLPSGDVDETTPIAGVVPVDLASPYVRGDETLGACETALPWPVRVAAGVGRSRAGSDGAAPWRSLDDCEQQIVLRCLGGAYHGIAAATSVCSTFVATFAQVVALRRDDHPQFCSFTSAYDLCRVSLINPHLLDDALLAEALVHETVHSMLFMLDQRVSWGFASLDGTGEQGSAYSPWTGRSLPVSTFLQACFVWYALVTFWGRALGAGSFPGDRARARLARAASGFSKGPLLANVDPRDAARLDPDVAAAIEDMERHVHTLIEA